MPNSTTSSSWCLKCTTSSNPTRKVSQRHNRTIHHQTDSHYFVNDTTELSCADHNYNRTIIATTNSQLSTRLIIRKWRAAYGFLACFCADYNRGFFCFCRICTTTTGEGVLFVRWAATQACLITIPGQRNGSRSRAQNSHTLPPQHWLVKNNCHKLRPEPVCDPQSNHGSCVLFLDVKVVEHHGLGLR